MSDAELLCIPVCVTSCFLCCICSLFCSAGSRELERECRSVVVGDGWSGNSSQRSPGDVAMACRNWRCSVFTAGSIDWLCAAEITLSSSCYCSTGRLEIYLLQFFVCKSFFVCVCGEYTVYKLCVNCWQHFPWQLLERAIKRVRYCRHFLVMLLFRVMPSVLWRCWLGIRKSIQPVNIEWWGVGVVICLERGAECLHIVQLMPCHPSFP